VEQHLFEWLARHGAPVLFLAQVFGIFGVPIPDELLMTIAGALIRRGTLAPSPIVTAAIAGCLAGITLSYVLGRTVGTRVVHRFAHGESVERAERWFCEYGAWLLAFGYYIPGVRHVTAIAAGSAPMEFGRFARFAYPGGVLWAVTFVGLGYVAGDRAPQMLDAVKAHVALAAVVAALIAVAYALTIARLKRRA
jgi:membrane protein DedA with SNARE-associated domain